MRYSPIDILRKFVMRKCIENLVWTSEHAIWFNITFWENVVDKACAEQSWQHLKKLLVRKYPGFRLVGVWARQRRGAWHIHAVCNSRIDIPWFKSALMHAGFGPQHYLVEVDNNGESPNKIARYITGYCTDKNGLDPVRDKGVRRMIFVGDHVRVMDMRYKSQLKMTVTRGRVLAKELMCAEMAEMTGFERRMCPPGERKKPFETWGEWYRRNRHFWFMLGWESYSKAEQEEIFELDFFVRQYFESGRWSYV